MSEWKGLTEISLEGIEVKKSIISAGRHVVKIAAVDIETKGIDRQMVITMETPTAQCKDWLTVHVGNYNDENDKDRAGKRLSRGLGRVLRIQHVLGATAATSIQPANFFIGKEIGIEVYEDNYMGKTQTKVGSYFGPSEVVQAAAQGKADNVPNDEIPF